MPKKFDSLDNMGLPNLISQSDFEVDVGDTSVSFLVHTANVSIINNFIVLTACENESGSVSNFITSYTNRDISIEFLEEDGSTLNITTFKNCTLIDAAFVMASISSFQDYVLSFSFDHKINEIPI